MNRVATKIAKEILMLLKHQHLHASPRQNISQHHASRSAASNATRSAIVHGVIVNRVIVHSGLLMACSSTNSWMTARCPRSRPSEVEGVAAYGLLSNVIGLHGHCCPQGGQACRLISFSIVRLDRLHLRIPDGASIQQRTKFSRTSRRGADVLATAIVFVPT